MLSTGAATIGIEAPSDTAKMKSILEMDDLSDFLVQAQLANKDFVSEREQFLNVDDVAREYVPTGQMGGAAFIYDENDARSRVMETFAFHELSVPRRPKWIPGVTTPEELEAMENESFLDWRRGVARRVGDMGYRVLLSHPMRRICTYGVSYGVFLNGRPLSCKSSMHAIHSFTYPRIYESMPWRNSGSRC